MCRALRSGKKADAITLAFKLSATDPEALKANAAVQAQALKVFALLKASGIAKEDIAAGDLGSDADYEDNQGPFSRASLSAIASCANSS